MKREKNYENEAAPSLRSTVGIAALICLGALLLMLIFVVVYGKITGNIKFGKSTSTQSNNVLVIDESAKKTSEIEHKIEEKQEEKEFILAGLPDSTVDEKSIVYLENLNTDFYLKYVVFLKNDETVLFETDLIPPECSVEWAPAESLNDGENVLVFRQIPFFKEGDNYSQVTIGENVVTFTKIS